MAQSSIQHWGFSVLDSEASGQSEASIIPTVYRVMEGEREFDGERPRARERERWKDIQRHRGRETKAHSDGARRTDKVTEPEKWVYKKHT